MVNRLGLIICQTLLLERAYCARFFVLMEVWSINAKDLSINEAIRENEVRAIDETGAQLGILKTAEALKIAEQKNLDLVLISPKANPPVCKIMDFGKYCYEQSKKEKEARKNQNIVTVKEVQLTLKIDTHDLNTKAENANRFLSGGDKVKVVVKFKGREMAHTELGYEIAERFFKLVEQNGVIEKPAKLEGRNMIMILAPIQTRKGNK